MRSLLYLCLALSAAGMADPVAAQQGLTEHEAVSRVTLESPRARAIRARVDVARADVPVASRWPNPRLTISREAVSGVTEDFLIASQSLPVTGRRRLQAESATQGVRSAELRAEDLLRVLRADARRAYIDLSIESERVRVLDASLADLQSLVAVLGKREAAGDAAGFDLLRAEREAMDVAAALGDARANRARAQGVLAGFFYPSPDPADLHVLPAVQARSPLPSPDDLAVRAETARPDLLAFDRDIEAAQLAGDAASRSRIPEPEVVAGMKTSSVGDGRRGFVVSLVTSIPLFDRARPERAVADARGRLALAEREALRAQIGAAVRALRQVVVERRSAADAYRLESLPRSAELRRIAQVSYEAGERGILELLDAFRSAADAALRLIELDSAAAHAEIDLELATAMEIRR